MRILLIESDPTTAKSIEMVLTSANLNIFATDLGEEGIDLAKLYDYDIIITELNLPDMTGFDVLKNVRDAGLTVPVMALTCADDTDSKLKFFGFGGDEYLTKPFHREELIARVHAIIRRSKGHSKSLIQTGEITTNLDAKVVEIGGKRVHLTMKEYQIFELLSLRKGVTLTKEMFLNHLYGGMDEPELKIVDVMICKIRRKLEAENNGESHIETVWGRGYRLVDPSVNQEVA